MNDHKRSLTFIIAIALLFIAILGCGKLEKQPDWVKGKKIAGKAEGLSHISGLVVDDEFAYVTIGGTIADQNEHTSGLRKVALNSGAIMTLENGEKLPQSETGGIAIDEKYVYWNAGGNILRISRNGGKPEVVASEHVGIGLDIAVDSETVYWANHGYYSANSPTKPSPIYSVSKKGGPVQIFADQQNIPVGLVADEKYVYWITQAGIWKQAKSGGQPQSIYQISNKEGVDELAQDADSLYFGFRSAGNSRWGLRKVSKQGGEPQTLLKTYSLKPVVIDDANIYFFDEDGLTNDVFCKIAKNGGEVTRIDTGYASGVITQSKNLVYIGSLDSIHSYKK